MSSWIGRVIGSGSPGAGVSVGNLAGAGDLERRQDEVAEHLLATGAAFAGDVVFDPAGDPAVIPLFVGLGVQELSATPAVVPAAKFLLRRLKQDEARQMTAEALQLGTAMAIYARSLALAKSVAPELFPES